MLMAVTLGNAATTACCHQLERLEADLSRFRHDSDVTRINHLPAGGSLLIAETTDACLRLALEMHAVTNGLFDVTLGAETWPAGSGSVPPAGSRAGQFALAPDQPRITCLAEIGRAHV